MPPFSIALSLKEYFFFSDLLNILIKKKVVFENFAMNFNE